MAAGMDSLVPAARSEVEGKKHGHISLKFTISTVLGVELDGLTFTVLSSRVLEDTTTAPVLAVSGKGFVPDKRRSIVLNEGKGRLVSFDKDSDTGFQG